MRSLSLSLSLLLYIRSNQGNVSPPLSSLLAITAGSVRDEEDSSTNQTIRKKRKSSDDRSVNALADSGLITSRDGENDIEGAEGFGNRRIIRFKEFEIENKIKGKFRMGNASLQKGRIAVDWKNLRSGL